MSDHFSSPIMAWSLLHIHDGRPDVPQKIKRHLVSLEMPLNYSFWGVELSVLSILCDGVLK